MLLTKGYIVSALRKYKDVEFCEGRLILIAGVILDALFAKERKEEEPRELVAVGTLLTKWYKKQWDLRSPLSTEQEAW